MRALLSSDAVTIRDPSGLKAAVHTTSVWPRRTAISLVLERSQIRAVLSPDGATLSPDAVMMRDPSGLKPSLDFDGTRDARCVAPRGGGSARLPDRRS